MNFQVTVTTEFKNYPNDKRILTYISADNLENAETIINDYNKKHPTWDMKLYREIGFSNEVYLPLELV